MVNGDLDGLINEHAMIAGIKWIGLNTSETFDLLRCFLCLQRMA